MVSKEGGKRMLTNSESDSEAAPSPSPAPSPSASLALEVKCSLEAGRQVRKRNKALQVRFKDICEAQNEQREAAAAAAAAAAAGAGGQAAALPAARKAAYRKYMTVPARRAIPNVTRSTGVQTSPDLKKRYQTFPFERKKGHTFKHAAAVESYRGQNNGFTVEAKQPPRAAGRGLEEDDDEEEVGVGRGGGRRGAGAVRRTRALLHTNQCMATVEQHAAPDGPGPLSLSCSPDAPLGAGAAYQLCSLPAEPAGKADGSERSAKRQLATEEEEEEEQVVGAGSSRTLPVRAPRVTGPIAWNSLTQVECLDSPTAARSKRKKGPQLNGLQAQTLPRAGCTTRAQCHVGQLSAQPLRAMEEPLPPRCPQDAAPGAPGASHALEPGSGEACKQIVPVTQEGDVKAQLQAMESMISSSQETIKVLLGVIQELEKGEAHREGLSYRTGQDTANCDTCRNNACIIYSVELDFKQQEDKLQPLMKRLCPAEDSHFPSLPYPQEGFASTPKRKSKADSKKHARWKLWFL